MGMVNCPRCGRLFNQSEQEKICVSCRKEEEQSFNDVRDYIEENPNATVAQVVTETKVSAKRIQKFLREGRLEATPGIGAILSCSGCGKDILSGRMCTACQNRLGSNIDQTLAKASADKKGFGGAKMHISRS